MNRKQDIFDFMNGRDISTSYQDVNHKSTYGFQEFVEVWNEGNRVKEEILSKLNGTYVLTAAIPATEESEEVPCVYYNYTTKSNLISSIISDLDIEKVLAYMVTYYNQKDYTNFVKLIKSTNYAI